MMKASKIKGKVTYFDGAAVARLIESAPMTQTVLAEQVGVHELHIPRVKKGCASVKLLASICRVLGSDYRQFLLPAEDFLVSSAKKTNFSVDTYNI